MTGPAGHDQPLGPTKGSPKLEDCKSTLPVTESTGYEVITVDDDDDEASTAVAGSTDGLQITVGEEASSEPEDHPATPTPEPPPTTATELEFAALLKKTFEEINKQLIVYEDTKPIGGLNRQEWAVETARICELVLAETSDVQDPEVFERLKTSLAEVFTKSESLRHATHSARQTMAYVAKSCIVDLSRNVSWNQQIQLDWVTKCRTANDVLDLMEDSVASAMVLEMHSDFSKTCEDVYNQFKLEKANKIFALVQTVGKYCEGMQARFQSSGDRCTVHMVRFWHLECLEETRGMRDTLDSEFKSVWGTLVEEAKNQVQAQVQVMLAELRKIEEEKERKKAEEESRGLANKYQESMLQRLSAQIAYSEVELGKIHHQVKERVLRDFKAKYERVSADFEEAIGVELDAEWEKVKAAEADKRKKTSEDSRRKKDETNSVSQVKPVSKMEETPRTSRSTSVNRSSRRRSRSPGTRLDRDNRYSSSRRSSRDHRYDDRSGRPRRSRSRDRTSTSRSRDKRILDSRRSPYDYDRRRRSRSRSPPYRSSRSDNRHYSSSRSRYGDRSRTPSRNARRRSKSRSREKSDYRDVKVTVTVDKFGRRSTLEPSSLDPKTPTPAELYLEWWTPLPATTTGELQCSDPKTALEEEETPKSDVETAGTVSNNSGSKTTSLSETPKTVELRVEPQVSPVTAVEVPATGTVSESSENVPTAATQVSSPAIFTQVLPGQTQAAQVPLQDIPSSCPDADNVPLIAKLKKRLRARARRRAKVADQQAETPTVTVTDDSSRPCSLFSDKPEEATGITAANISIPAVPAKQQPKETLSGSPKRPSSTDVQDTTTTAKKIRIIPETDYQPQQSTLTAEPAKVTPEIPANVERAANPEISQKTSAEPKTSEVVHADPQPTPASKPSPESPRTSDFLHIVITETDLILEAFVDGIETFKTLAPYINLALDLENQVVLPNSGDPGETIDIMQGLIQPDALLYIFDGENGTKLLFDQILALYFTSEIIRPLGFKSHHLSTVPVRIAISSTMSSGSRHQLLNGFKIAGFKLDDHNTTLVQMTTALTLGLPTTRKEMLLAYIRNTSIEAAFVHVTESGCHETKVSKTLELVNPESSNAISTIRPKSMLTAGVAEKALVKFLLIDPAVKSPESCRAYSSENSSRWIRLYEPQKVALAGLKKISNFVSASQRHSPQDLYKERFPYSVSVKSRGNENFLALRNQDTMAKSTNVVLKPGHAAQVIMNFGVQGEPRTRVPQALIHVAAKHKSFKGAFIKSPNQVTVHVTVDSQGLIEVQVPDQFKNFVNTTVYYMSEGFEEAVAHVRRILGETEPRDPVQLENQPEATVQHGEEREPQLAVHHETEPQASVLLGEETEPQAPVQHETEAQAAIQPGKDTGPQVPAQSQPEPQVPDQHGEEAEPPVSLQQTCIPLQETATTKITSDFVIKYSPLDPRFHNY